MRIAQPIMGAVLKWQFNQHCTNLKTVLETERCDVPVAGDPGVKVAGPPRRTAL
jgi:hypothetical protein